eukprot:6214462-Pleurochrysis_carterae.AAC.5
MASAGSGRAGKQFNPPTIPLEDHCLLPVELRSERSERPEVRTGGQAARFPCRGRRGKLASGPPPHDQPGRAPRPRTYHPATPRIRTWGRTAEGR